MCLLSASLGLDSVVLRAPSGTCSMDGLAASAAPASGYLSSPTRSLGTPGDAMVAQIPLAGHGAGAAWLPGAIRQCLLLPVMVPFPPGAVLGAWSFLGEVWSNLLLQTRKWRSTEGRRVVSRD